MKRVFIDCETTGVDPARSGLWSIAALFEIDGEVVDTISLEFAPVKGKLISQQALEKCGVTIEELRQMQPPEQAHRALVGWLAKRINRYSKTDKSVFSAFCAPFDYAFLRQYFLDMNDSFFGCWFLHPFECQMAKAGLVLLPERHKMMDFKLGTVCRYMGIDFDEELAHNALFDVQKTRELSMKLDERIHIT